MKETIENYLERLAPYARVTIYQGEDDTWSATARLRIQALGSVFEVDSDFGYAEAVQAVQELLRRVQKVVEQASDLPLITNEEGNHDLPAV